MCLKSKKLADFKTKKSLLLQVLHFSLATSSISAEPTLIKTKVVNNCKIMNIMITKERQWQRHALDRVEERAKEEVEQLALNQKHTLILFPNFSVSVRSPQRWWFEKWVPDPLVFIALQVCFTLNKWTYPTEWLELPPKLSTTSLSSAVEKAVLSSVKWECQWIFWGSELRWWVCSASENEAPLFPVRSLGTRELGGSRVPC